MVNKIRDGIISAIAEEFGDDYEIITENLKQGLKTPCFSVICIDSKTIKTIGERYRNNNQFCVYYFPGSEYEPREECFKTLARLIDILEYITVDGNLVRGINFSGTVEDNVLVFVISYNMNLIKDGVQKSKMGGLKINSEVNNG